MIPEEPKNKKCKYTRKRKILSCFRCRYLRNKCDRAKPMCSRCVESNAEKCEYMSDNGSREEYIMHLKNTGHKDNRVIKDDELTRKKVRFDLPKGDSNGTKRVMDKQFSKLIYKTAMDLKAPLKKDNLSYISILDKSINETPSTDNAEKKLSLRYTDEVFSNGLKTVNKLFVKNKIPGSKEPFEYQVTAQSSLSLEQMFLRLLPFKVKVFWRELALDYYHEIDFKKYHRLSLGKSSDTKFLDKWNVSKQNLLDELLKALPRKFEDFKTIVFEYFNNDLHKTFPFLNESDIKGKFHDIFKYNKKTGLLTSIILEENQDQYYLGIILLLFQLLIDPEIYFDPIFEKVDDIVCDVKIEKYKNGYLRCQYYLLILFRNEMQFKATFSTNKKVINDLLSWAREIEKSFKDNESLDGQDQEIIDNVWYWITYFEVLAYIELGISPKFNYHFINDKPMVYCERGRVPLMKKLSFLVGKIALACENPSFDPDIDYLCYEIDKFIERNLAPLCYYMDTEKCKKVDTFDFNILNPLLTLKLSLWSYKYALTTEESEYERFKNKLCGLCYVALTVFNTQQSKILFIIKSIDNINTYCFDKQLANLKKHERLSENENRPPWIPQMIGPNFMMFCSDWLYERAVNLIEFVAFLSLKDYFKSENKVTLCQKKSDDFLVKLNLEFINFGLGKTKTFDLSYSPMDFILLHDKLIHLRVERAFQLPRRISHPGFLLLEFACIIKEIFERISVKNNEKFTYQHLADAYEIFKSEKKKPLKDLDSHSNINTAKEVSTSESLISSDSLDFNELWLDIEDVEMMDFMKLLN
ncbi:uncharacterized protein HGUI_01709 [Hanseniaspora guilliermondii]|uniref:Zn(2)-C6 fungal-type domain-containing protein n=1 Tax=Hanseniaspora guilliermondii TaxID=56406 RepID=A0A1L0CKX3_9ASCO|nr:uncharacterized protein HGUI_01709 [Hanseniaspora guilliermondii]